MIELPEWVLFGYLTLAITAAVLLFYFVGPRGWANRIGNKKSRLRTAFSRVLVEDVRPLIGEAMTIEVRALREAFTAELKALETKMGAISVTLDPAAIASMITPAVEAVMVGEKVKLVIDGAIERGLASKAGKHLRGFQDRAADADKEALELAKFQQDNPEEFELLMKALNWVETIGPTLGWKPGKIKAQKDRFIGYARTGISIKQMMEQQGINVSGSATGGGARGAPAGGGAHF